MIRRQIRVYGLALCLCACPLAVLAQDIPQTPAASAYQTDDRVRDLEELIATQLGPLGNCETPEGQQIAMGDILFIENRDIPLDGGDRTTRASIRGQYLDIVRDGEQGVVTRRRMIEEEVDFGTDLDLELKFVLIDGAIGLYWRETFQHRVHRQGLFRITGERLSKICEGHRGISVDH